MSAPIKRKITLELPKAKDLSKNRLSVFQRLGTKKVKTQTATAVIPIVENNKDEAEKVIEIVPPPVLTPLATAVAIITEKLKEIPKPVEKPTKWDQSTLEDASSDLLEKKREELQQELKLQIEMDASKKKEMAKKIKKVVRSSSSSDSSSSSGSDSSSDDSSSSSSTTSRESRRKVKKRNIRQRRDSSSSSDHGKKPIKKHLKQKVDVQKRLALKKAALINKIKIKKAGSPSQLRKRSVSPSTKAKYAMKAKMMAAKKEKMIADAKAREKEREFQLREKEREREKEKLRYRERERGRSRSSRSNVRSRSPRRISPTGSRGREVKRKSQDRRGGSPGRYRTGSGGRRDRSDDRSVDRSSVRRHETIKERDRRERMEKEAARDKERQEALARCQERQRERERIAKEKMRRMERDRDNVGGLDKPDRHRPVERLLPRPADRARALAAARSPGKSIDRDRSRSAGSPRRRGSSFDRGDRPYDHHDRRSRSREREFAPIRPRRDEPPYDRPPIRDNREYRDADRNFDDRIPRTDRRIPHEYPRGEYPDDPPPRRELEREWERDPNIPRDPDRRFDRPEHSREWERELPPGGHIEPVREWNEWNEAEGWAGNEKEREWKYKERGGWTEPHLDEHMAPAGVPPHPHQPRRWQPEWHGKPKEEHMEFMPRHPHKAHPKEIMGERPMYRRHHPGHPAMYHHQGPRKPHMGMLPNRFQNPNKYSLNRTQNPMGPHLNQFIPNRVQTPPVGIVRASLDPNVEVKITPSPTLTNIPVLGEKIKEEEGENTPLETAVPTGDEEIKTETDAEVPTSMPSPVKTAKIENSEKAAVEEGEEEDNLSEISDDPDDILTREEDDDIKPISSSPPPSTSSLLTYPQRPGYHFLSHNKFQNFKYATNDLYSTIGLQPFRPDYEPENMEQSAEHAEANENLELDENAHSNLKDEEQMERGDGEIPEDLNDSKIAGKIHANKELKEEMDLDFEEISDGELEEDSKFKGLGDALGVDWAGLVQESRKSSLKPEQAPISAKKRWQSHRILLDIGISVKMAGEEFAQQVLTEAKTKLQEEIEEMKLMQVVKKEEVLFGGVKIKKEILDEDEMEMKQEEVKEEHVEEDNNELEDVDKIIHPVAAIQVAFRDRREFRKNLILKATGPYSRALSARRDLQIRRQLCGFPIHEINDRPVDAGVSTELRDMAIKLFQNTIHNKIKVQ